MSEPGIFLQPLMLSENHTQYTDGRYNRGKKDKTPPLDVDVEMNWEDSVEGAQEEHRKAAEHRWHIIQ